MKKYFKIAIFLLFIGGIFLAYNITIRNFKSSVAGKEGTTVFYDKTGKPFYSLIGEEGRTYIPIEKMNRKLLMSVLAVEDARFFQHFGFDIPRLAKIFQYWITNQDVYFGASTITQQLSKIVLLSSERTIKRKILELITAIFLEIRYSKKDILELYLNTIYFGKNSYGIEAAAQNYFGKTALEVNLAEAAILAALIKKPEGYSPLNDLDLTRDRQIIVLKRLLKLDWIDKQQYIAALETPVIVLRTYSHRRRAPYFVAAVMQTLKAKYGPEILYKKGLKVYTTLDWTAQNAMERVTTQAVSSLEPDTQVAGIMIEHQSGQVRALVGGRSYAKSQFNRTTQALRPPGSAIKPFVYALALERGWQPSQTLIDEPIAYLGDDKDLFSSEGFSHFYEPQNFNQEHLGEITLAYALQSSNNVVSVNLLHHLGIGNYVNFTKDLNLNINHNKGLCLALGCNEVSLLNLASSYTVFPNRGLLCPVVFYTEIVTASGEVLEDGSSAPICRQVMSQDSAYLMSSLLSAVIKNGTGRAARINRYAAGKTGTSDQFRDAWFLGFTDSYTSGFWLGKDDNSPMAGETGGRTPAKMWQDYMLAIPEEAVNKQNGYSTDWESANICGLTGYLATSYCPIVLDVTFKAGFAPQEPCPEHGEGLSFYGR